MEIASLGERRPGMGAASASTPLRRRHIINSPLRSSTSSSSFSSYSATSFRSFRCFSFSPSLPVPFLRISFYFEIPSLAYSFFRKLFLPQPSLWLFLLRSPWSTIVSFFPISPSFPFIVPWFSHNFPVFLFLIDTLPSLLTFAVDDPLPFVSFVFLLPNYFFLKNLPPHK